MSEQTKENGKPHKPRFVCALTGAELPHSAVVNLATVLPSLADRIRKDHPNVDDNAFIAREELDRYRTLYVTELLHAESGDLNEIESQVAKSLATHETLAANVEDEFGSKRTLSERLSDGLAEFGGSWSFLIFFAAFLGGWMLISLHQGQTSFDPYPYIFLNLMLSMPAGTNANLLQCAVREFAEVELAGHRYVMVLHEHQANPHVHLSVRAESRSGKRLNPRKADLQRWRETFAEKLRALGIDAEATRQAVRGESRKFDPLWRVKAKVEGRLRREAAPMKSGARAMRNRADAMASWTHIAKALADSDATSDQVLGQQVAAFVRGAPYARRLHVAASHVRPEQPQEHAIAQDAVREEPSGRR